MGSKILALVHTMMASARPMQKKTCEDHQNFLEVVSNVQADVKRNHLPRLGPTLLQIVVKRMSHLFKK